MALNQVSPTRTLPLCPSSTEQCCLPGSSTLQSPSLLEAVVPQCRGTRQLCCMAGVSRALLSLPSKQHLAGPGQPPGSLWCAAHLLFTAKSSLPCHSPQQTQASCSLHITLTVPLPRRVGGGTSSGVARWVLGLVTQLRSQHCWTHHWEQLALLPRLGLGGECGYNSLCWGV